MSNGMTKKRPRDGISFSTASSSSHEKDRPAAAQHYMRHLRLGTFDGSSICANCLDPSLELLENGHVSIHNLILPDCTEALVTTFAPPDDAWLESLFADGTGNSDSDMQQTMIHRLTVITHDDRAPHVGQARVEVHSHSSRATSATSDTAKEQRCWQSYWIRCKPHTAGCLHAKLLLFRSNKGGLRVVVSGNNFCQRQWLMDRDCLWIQDFFPSCCFDSNADDGADNGTTRKRRSSSSSDISSSAACSNHSEFGKILKDFLFDMASCRTASDNLLVKTQIMQPLFRGVDFSTAHRAAKLVYSFPRSSSSSDNNKTKNKEKGGYQQLASMVRSLYCEVVDPGSDQEEEEEEDSSPCWDESSVEGGENRVLVQDAMAKPSTLHTKATLGLQQNDNEDDDCTGILYVTSGSFGNLQPDFMYQMYKAMVHGTVAEQGPLPLASLSTPSSWQALFGKIRCLWPSRETALTMNLLSLIGNTRPMPRSYWRDFIPTDAKRSLFFDALPNPMTKPPPSMSSTESGFPVSHCKVMYYAAERTNDHSVRPRPRARNRDDSPASRTAATFVYVGSHNFSKSAWGLRASQPKNVELGVVLATTCPNLRREWKNRLPCQLPSPSRVPLSSPTYIPASAHSDIKDTLMQGKVDEALEMVREWLTRDDSQSEQTDDDDMITLRESSMGYRNTQHDTKRVSKELKAEVIDLCNDSH